MKPVFERAQAHPKRIVYAEGEDERVLRAARTVLDEGMAKPILIGRRDVIAERCKQMGLRLDLDEDVEVVEILRDIRYHSYSDAYHRLMRRRGVSPDYARTIVRSRNTVFAALMVQRGEADGMICGSSGRYAQHLQHILDVLGVQPGSILSLP